MRSDHSLSAPNPQSRTDTTAECYPGTSLTSDPGSSENGGGGKEVSGGRREEAEEESITSSVGQDVTNVQL